MWFLRRAARTGTLGRRPVPLGTEVLAGGYELRVHELLDPHRPPGGAQPAEGLRLAAVDVELVNTTLDRVLGYRKNQWKVYDARGYVFDYLYDDRLIMKPSLLEGSLNPGTNVRGWVTFAVSQSAKLARVQFTVSFLDDTAVDFLVPPPAE
jgi:hypothetical protein